MGKLDDRLAKLGTHVNAKREELLAKRQQAWKRIQEEAPEIADFLQEINQEFGKPAKVWVEINNERIL